ncbi:MAG TPA: AAA family ATPase [Candidatus Caccosoma faecigallinarum]|uniref:AAA family ATPase n=1 Tax=Candidatus Caccosoma faecigallinarum TaxID=2840720 RepID=A0A9D1G8P4_9FIRM|nr:AAA family ATPase [Candidatus Caccosoma faecigallinarum]
MVITRIKQIKNIGTYKNSGNGRIQLKPFTFIYAANTYGKTTFCDIMRSLKTNDISYINNRRRIGIKDSEKCLVSLTIDNENIVYDGEKWIVPAGYNIRNYLEIFDINFVNENVFTNFKIEHKNKESFTSFILGERGVELAKTLAYLEQTLSDKEQEFKENKAKLDKKLKDIAFDDIKKQKYNDNFKDTECLLISVAEEIKKLSNQLSEIDKIKSIKKIDSINVDQSKLRELINTTKEICAFKHDIDLTQLKKRVEDIREETAGLSDQWYKDGIKSIKTKCPLCGNIITDNERIKILSEYFSEIIITFLDKVEKCQNEIIRNFKERSIASNLIKFAQQKDLIMPYFNGNSDLPSALNESFKQLTKIANDISSFVEKSKEELESNLLIKLSSVNKVDFEFSKSATLLTYLDEMDSILSIMNEQINDFNQNFKEYQEKLSNEYLLSEISKHKSEFSRYNLIVLRGQYNEEIDSLIQIEGHIKELKDKIKVTKTKFDSQQEDFLNKYFADIQQIYSKLGSENYRIERETTSRGKKKVYGVKIYFRDKLIDETRFCMSESDRRALALSVFLAKIKIDNNPNSILILDDPVTSFDKDRMRNFISIINELKSNCFGQLIILMHYENFFRLITKATEDKTLIKLVRDKDDHVFNEIYEDDDMFSNEYENALNHIIKFINAESNCIKENDVRIFFEKYLHNYYAYEISKNPSIKGGRLHDFILGLEKEKLISTATKEDLILKLKFLNDSSHSFTDYPIEDQRSFVKDTYFSLHNLGMNS